MLITIKGCGYGVMYEELPTTNAIAPVTTIPSEYIYLIGPGDSLDIFVWRNPEVSTTVIVRPDGMINVPLVEDLSVTSKTPTQVAREIETELSKYIKEPIVSVNVGGFIGPYREQVRVIGEAAEPQSLPYNEDMTLLDLMIVVGGLTDFADGNMAILARVVDDEQRQYTIRIDDLVRDGDLSANVDILPGDIIIIPEAWF
ncbi:MAG: polysaccharide export protein [Gammaproteobacteria bacterium]|nr:polysaccharide export protein [Gammaproteobacteria bacterium]